MVGCGADRPVVGEQVKVGVVEVELEEVFVFTRTVVLSVVLSVEEEDDDVDDFEELEVDEDADLVVDAAVLTLLVVVLDADVVDPAERLAGTLVTVELASLDQVVGSRVLVSRTDSIE